MMRHSVLEVTYFQVGLVLLILGLILLLGVPAPLITSKSPNSSISAFSIYLAVLVIIILAGVALIAYAFLTRSKMSGKKTSAEKTGSSLLGVFYIEFLLLTMRSG